MKSSRTGPHNRGIATLELLIALALGVIALSGATLISFGAQTAGLDAGLTNHGLYRAQNTVHDAAAAVTADWDSSAGFSEDDGYAMQEYLSDVSPCLKLVGGDAQWDSDKNRHFTTLFETLVANIDAALALGGACSPFPPGKWDNPGNFGSVVINPPGLKATGLAVASLGGVRYAFVTTVHGAAGTNDFWVIDTSDPENPTVIASLNTGKGLNGVAIGGTHAYVIQNDSTEQLQVISLANPSSPTLVATVSLEDYGVDPDGSNPQGRSITYHDGRVYLGFGRTAGPELHAFDASDPAALSHLASIEINRNVNALAVRGGLVYLATGSGDAGVNNPLKIYDLSSLSQIGSFTAAQTNNQAGMSLYLLGSKLYLGLQRAGNASHKDFYILDISNPAAPALLGAVRNESACAKQPNCGLNPNTAITGVVVQGRYAFLSTTAQTAGFQVWDVSDPSNIRQPSVCSSFNYSEKASGLVYADNLIFVSNESNDALRIIYDKPAQCS